MPSPVAILARPPNLLTSTFNPPAHNLGHQSLEWVEPSSTSVREGLAGTGNFVVVRVDMRTT